MSESITLTDAGSIGSIIQLIAKRCKSKIASKPHKKKKPAVAGYTTKL
ncbi:MAG: hypothetical protein V7K64_25025 [Nostoc sp.]|nr:hypothetical protein [Nostoc sp. JL34]MBN3884668.1 hypothetical protein [Nostoc sp. JL34]